MAWTTATTRSSGFAVTAAVWNAEHVDNMNFLKRVAYAEFTGDVSITATTVGTANSIVSAGAFTYEASTAYEIEFFCCLYSAPAQVTNIIIHDGSAVVGTIARVPASASQPLSLLWRVSPGAGSKTYSVRAWLAGAGTGTMEAGSGGTSGDASSFLAGHIEVRRIPA
jgi:hypothetical protein